MAKAVKLKNSLYLSSTSIVHKRGGGWHYLNDLLDNIYPIGSIHMTTNNVNPSTYFGGTWERMSGGYLYATSAKTLSKTSYTGWHTQSHTLSINEIPSHSHGINFDQIWGWGGTTSIATTSGGPYGGSGYIQNTGGGSGHTHNIATIDVYIWKRTA